MILTLLELRPDYSLKKKEENTIPADALAPCIIRSSSADME